jgi:hypothetical protein
MRRPYQLLLEGQPPRSCALAAVHVRAMSAPVLVIVNVLPERDRATIVKPAAAPVDVTWPVPGTDVQAGLSREVRVTRIAGGVVLGVGVARLDLRDHVARGRLGLGVLTLRALTEEARQSDRGEDADDQDDDQKLDEREALLVLGAGADLVQHGPVFGATRVP